jgi:S-formylglutathione hydrolase FrmB
MAAPLATPEIIIVTAIPSDTPAPTLTPTFTPSPTFTPTVPATATPTTLPCLSDGGRIEEFRDNRSEIANGENLRYRVYVPPCYQESLKRFPVLYLLHGSSFAEGQWEELGIVDALEQGMGAETLGPMLIVMPYMGSIGSANTFPPDPSYETVILEELVPKIERDFCTWESRDYRAIGGISRGGFWAMSIALRHPDVFGYAGGHSPVLDNNFVPTDFNPVDLARNADIKDANLRIYLNHGIEDSVGLSVAEFSQNLSARQIPHTLTIHPVGGHDEEYWGSHVNEYLRFYGQDWAKNINDLPTCLEESPS